MFLIFRFFYVAFKKVVKYLFITTLSFVLFFAFLYSPVGFKLALDIVSPILNKYDVFIDTNNMSGSLGNFKIKNIIVKTNAANVTVKDAEINWNISSLIFRHFDVNDLQVRKLEVFVKDTPASNKPTTGVNIPLLITANLINIPEIDIILEHQSKLEFTDFSANLKLENDDFYINYFKGDGFEKLLSFDINDGYIQLNSPFKTHADIDYKIESPNFIIPKGHIDMVGEFDNVFTANISSATVFKYASQSGSLDISSDISAGKIETTIHNSSFGNQVFDGYIDFYFPKNKPIYWNSNLNVKNTNIDIPLKYKDIMNFNTVGNIDSIDSKTKIWLETCDFKDGYTNFDCKLSLDIFNDNLILNELEIENIDKNDILNLQGKVLPSADLNWNSHIKDFSIYSNILKGSLTSKGSLLGTLKKPLIDGFIDINQLNVKGYNFGDINIAFFSDNNYQDLSFNQKSSNDTVNFTVEGSHTKNGYVAKIDNFSILKNDKTWNNLGVVNLNIGKQISLNNFCLTHKEQFACADFKYKDENINFNSAWSFFPNILNDFLPISKSTSKNNGFLEFNKINNIPIWGSSRLYLDKGTIYLSTKNNKGNKFFGNADEFPIKIKKFKSNMFYNAFSIWYKAEGLFNEHDNLDFIGSIYHVGDDYKINTSSKFSWENLQPFSVFSTIPINLDGKVNGNVITEGLLDNLDISGEINLKSLNLKIIPYGTYIKNSNLNVKFYDKNFLEISGHGNIGKGAFDIKGNSEDFLDKNNFTLSVIGHTLNVINLPDLMVNISPTLTINKSKNSLKVSGNIDVDNVNIGLESLESLSSNSNAINDDIIFVNSPLRFKTTNITNDIIDFTVNLGNKTKIFGYGLKSDLSGKLDVFSGKDSNFILANGEVYFLNGKIIDFGKSFTIDSDSHVSFHNSIITSPHLDLTAYYDIPPRILLNAQTINPPTMLGIKVLGNALKPTIDLISTPSMPKTDILSYILFGNPHSDSKYEKLQQAKDNDTTQLTQIALLAAINGGGSGAIDVLKNTFGISDFSIGDLGDNYLVSDDLKTLSSGGNTQGDNTTAVFVGKSFGDRLYLNYGFGVFTGQQDGNATYKLSKHVSLLANINPFDTGTDFVYTKSFGVKKPFFTTTTRLFQNIK